MESFLMFFAFIMLVGVIVLVVNERFFKIPAEIALLIGSLFIGILGKILLATNAKLPFDGMIMNSVLSLKIDEVLMDGILCFMLFSGASDLKFGDLRKNSRPISLLALLTTAVSTFFYGTLCYLILGLMGFFPNYILCLLLASVVSPTDPIAATGILNKLGLSKELVSIIEGESLFNDGTGVVLFVFLKGAFQHSNENGFFMIMAKEILGAAVLALVISFICTKLVKITKNDTTHLIISLFAVSSCYAFCERFGFSGVIASVICGIYFATSMEKYRELGIISSESNSYDEFWESIDKILNYVLYIFIGMSFVTIVKIKHIYLGIIFAVLLNFLSRYIGVFTSASFMGKIPEGYTKGQFSLLMTWAGLKGGLCLALALSLFGYIPTRYYNATILMVFAIILFTTIIQGLTVDRLYLYLKKKNKQQVQSK